MSFKKEIDSDSYDFAMLRLDCAANLLTLVGSQFDQEDSKFSHSVINSAIFGIGLLVEDANNALAH
jgi:hypothetical protein